MRKIDLNSRRDFLKKLGAGTSLLGLSGLGAFLPSEASAAPRPRLTILHTNDMHSRIEPFPQDGRRFAGMGGMARRASLIEQIRQEEEHVLLLDAGDIFQGTPYFNFYEGELEFKLMTEMGYDAATLGNHDFDNGLEGLKAQLPNAGFPFLVANYDFSNTILEGAFKPFRIFEKGPIKVGVFGLGIELEGLVSEKHFEGVRYLEPVAVAREMVQELKAQGCHLVVCLSHLGYEYEQDKISDLKLAALVEGIDLIIGGHTHTFLEEPTVVRNPAGEDVLVNQVGWAGINVGRIDYTFEKRKEKMGVFTASLPVSEKSSRI
ncbi:metallophosphoesterase [Nafulsella turpanensis]|uniref:metallophosphoesterase n=1 Tax=Nafulsella turpanensis TaxID=1265690 RepID=UPI000347C483|nr:metallophosphoesterase [Nafulsella turpanensis]